MVYQKVGTWKLWLPFGEMVERFFWKISEYIDGLVLLQKQWYLLTLQIQTYENVCDSTSISVQYVLDTQSRHSILAKDRKLFHALSQNMPHKHRFHIGQKRQTRSTYTTWLLPSMILIQTNTVLLLQRSLGLSINVLLLSTLYRCTNRDVSICQRT